MTLANRAMLFVLSALAVVLLTFSAALTWLAADDLDREQNERLESALATLSAIVEQSPGGWEWEPHGRSLIVGGVTAAEALPWCVSDDRGRIVDRSRRQLLPHARRRVPGGNVQRTRGPPSRMVATTLARATAPVSTRLRTAERARRDLQQ